MVWQPWKAIKFYRLPNRLQNFHSITIFMGNLLCIDTHIVSLLFIPTESVIKYVTSYEMNYKLRWVLSRFVWHECFDGLVMKAVLLWLVVVKDDYCFMLSCITGWYIFTLLKNGFVNSYFVSCSNWGIK